MEESTTHPVICCWNIHRTLSGRPAFAKRRAAGNGDIWWAWPTGNQEWLNRAIYDQQQKGFTYYKDKQSWHESGHHYKLKQSHSIYPAESTQTKRYDRKVHRHYTASYHARYKYQERPSEKNTNYAGFIANVTARSTNIICSTLSSFYIHTDISSQHLEH